MCLSPGLALHLDMCHPDSALPTEAMAWHALASLLHRTALAALQALQRYKKPPSARKRAKMEPGKPSALSVNPISRLI